ncbi:MAG: class I SAM-dependent methyltransferase [Nitrospira sp.]|nr:class I SAM-dependent methyltransferase [Nitrospira sp.]
MIKFIHRSFDHALVRLTSALLRRTLRSPQRAKTPIIDRLLRDIAPSLNCLTALGDTQGDELRDLLRSMLLDTLPEDAKVLIPSLVRRDVPVRNTWVYQNEVMEWDIPINAQVLDVGSGGWPFKRATALADKYVGPTTHRVEPISKDTRPFFEVDLQKLPFEDKSYDFIFCSHVLEHIDNPGAAMRELMRVGRRGYIEVPTRLSDVMFNFTRIPNHHRWHGLVLGTTLLLVEWADQERRELGNEFFNALQSSRGNAFQDFFERNRDIFFASCQWSESFDFLVINKQGHVIDASSDAARENFMTGGHA